MLKLHEVSCPIVLGPFRLLLLAAAAAHLPPLLPAETAAPPPLPACAARNCTPRTPYAARRRGSRRGRSRGTRAPAPARAAAAAGTAAPPAVVREGAPGPGQRKTSGTAGQLRAAGQAAKAVDWSHKKVPAPAPTCALHPPPTHRCCQANASRVHVKDQNTLRLVPGVKRVVALCRRGGRLGFSTSLRVEFISSGIGAHFLSDSEAAGTWCGADLLQTRPGRWPGGGRQGAPVPTSPGLHMRKRGSTLSRAWQAACTPSRNGSPAAMSGQAQVGLKQTMKGWPSCYLGPWRNASQHPTAATPAATDATQSRHSPASLRRWRTVWGSLT